MDFDILTTPLSDRPPGSDRSGTINANMSGVGRRASGIGLIRASLIHNHLFLEAY
jgi:hypothetical protein